METAEVSPPLEMETAEMSPPLEMETAAAPACSEKRKLPVLDCQAVEKPADAAEAPDPEPIAKKGRASDSREAPASDAEEDGEGVYHISDLPDGVLGDIVSLLPTKDAARTQALATRWRNIWRFAPLNLDCADLWDLRMDWDDLTSVVSRIISAHRGPGRRLCVLPRYLHNRPAAADTLLRSPALDNLEELDLCYVRARYQSIVPLRPPPASIFRFSSTLRSATITHCHLPDAIAQALHLPQLRQLALEHVEISEDSLHSLIAGCPVLECLLLSHNCGFRSLRINSPTLTSIGFDADYGERFDADYGEQETRLLGEVIIEDAPCLERLLYLELNRGVNVSVISAPKLETLGCLFDLCTNSRLLFGSTVIQGMRVNSLATVVRSVKILAVHMDILCLDTVIDLMRCFPCLEKLYVKFCRTGLKNLWRRKHRDLVKTLDLRLKTIVLENFRGIQSQVNFATFFVLNAGMLELMRLEVAPKDYNHVFFTQQHEMLHLEKSASRGVRLEFTTDWCHQSVSHIKHVRDMDLIDPFECRCFEINVAIYVCSKSLAQWHQEIKD